MFLKSVSRNFGSLKIQRLFKALGIYEYVLGKQHPDYATSLHNLTYLYQYQDQYEQALPLYKQAVEIFTKALGKEHPNTKVIKRNYEMCLMAFEQNVTD